MQRSALLNVVDIEILYPNLIYLFFSVIYRDRSPWNAIFKALSEEKLLQKMAGRYPFHLGRDIGCKYPETFLYSTRPSPLKGKSVNR